MLLYELKNAGWFFQGAQINWDVVLLDGEIDDGSR